MTRTTELQKMTDAALQVAHRVQLTWKSDGLGSLFPLTAHGVILKTRPGASIKSTLCEIPGVTEEYVHRRIRAVFLNGKTIDDVDSARLDAGATVALSGVIPEPFLRHAVGWRPPRPPEALRDVPSDIEPMTGVTEVFFELKIFNVLARELGPPLLALGVWISPKVMQDFFHRRGAGFWANLIRAVIDDREVDGDSLSHRIWSGTPGLIRLTVHSP